ncbi:T9SS type A sorting domain-containing protein [Lewinella sp. JB7]|uniref:T9SS type A sorting domain-containing protein n=1 Tax=Lewinella sp. JB7 TaxID=2962887 RepID=UPI0020CA1BFD|nr:T9SS type A sorting domain-containing protein [Lewinella sp. JB7]MCP9236445.1 T9SS type A sorting domain-containing protein [Lewinella sp. JB7]
MRIFLLLPLAAGMSCALAAQDLTPQVLATGGGTGRTSGLILDWTLGQLVTHTVDLPAGILTQGFHQPDLLIVEANPSALEAGPRVSVFPNPVSAELNVRASGFAAEEYTVLQLLDVRGRMVLERRHVHLLDGLKLDFAHLPASTYTLRVARASGELPQTFTVTKIR